MIGSARSPSPSASCGPRWRPTWARPACASPAPGRRDLRHRAFLALGSNLGDRWGHLGRAVAGIPDLVRTSGVYETEPVGGPAGQGPFLNAVAELETALGPRPLLDVCRRLEQAAGRVRPERFGPRSLDVDVLLVGDHAVDEPDLVVPHPRMWERAFVLVPLAELAPDLVPDPPEDPSVRLVGPPLRGRRHLRAANPAWED